MKKNKMLIAVLFCSSAIAWSLTGCSAKETAGADVSQAVESSVSETETASAAETESSADETDEETADGQVQEGAASETEDPLLMELGKVWGPVLSVGEDQISIDNQAETAGKGEVIVQIDPEHTKILDAVDGFPVQIEDIQESETIYAYIKPMMTMSLPPIVIAEAVICQVPQDAAAPEYVRVQEMEQQKDDSYLLTISDGTQYQVPADCEIIPYLTRNLVRLTDVQRGSTCLLWTDGAAEVQKIVLFAD